MRGPNMSYCKWENTAAAMEQCLAEGEDDFNYWFDGTQLSDHEMGGMRRCLRAAYAMLEAAPRDLLESLDINLENLA